jgi:signal transduction histidine kinase/integral membrane sensor domain MASE1
MNPSVLWPPNAILTATLLLTPPRTWWIYLLAALPAHLIAQLPAGWPTTLVLALFVTNCSEAVVAAAGVRRFSDGRSLFDTLRGVAVFILCAVFVAPFVSSFGDAAAVATLRGESYWLAWRTRFFANVLTELTLVPMLVMVVGTGLARIKDTVRRRSLETVLLWLGLLVIGFFAFEGPGARPDGLARFFPVTLAFFLPFFLWATVRLGPFGTALSLLTVELLAIWGGARGRGPFTILSPLENVLSLQIFLIVVAVPLMCLAAVIREWHHAQQTVEERLRFEEVLSQLSGAFVHVPSQKVDETIEVWLRHLGESLGIDHITLFRPSPGGNVLVPTQSWVAHGRHVPKHQHRAQAPRDNAPEGSLAPRIDFPLTVAEEEFGVLRFEFRAIDGWPKALVPRLRLVADVFANAIARKQGEDALRASELMKAAILSSLTSSVAALDREGRIIAINEAGRRFGDNGAGSEDCIGIGASHVQLCRYAMRVGSAYAREALVGIESVINGVWPRFSLEYPCSSPSVERWHAMSVVPLQRPEGGAVVTHTDITEHKRAEIEAQRSRQELAHLTRVSTMGEFTGWLADELNQSLTGILSNAQAAQRFLAATPPSLGEVRESLSDIVADDRRASEVIRRLRELLKRGQTRPAPLDVNALISEVAKLLGTDALIKDLLIMLELDGGLPLVKADRLQLQQVVLSLLVNAMEAMTETAAAGRIIVVRTECTNEETVHVAVQDAGIGVAEGTEAHIFEPFYTTKPGGMGMGLSIARSIVEAYGGHIWATNNTTGGATFHFTLGAVKEPV